MKHIRKIFESESSSRDRLKSATREVSQYMNQIEEMYSKLRSLSREIDSATRALRSENDNEAADLAENVFGSFEGNFLFSLKDAYKYKPKGLQTILDMGPASKNESLKAPKILNISDEDFSAFVAFLKSKFKNATHVGQQQNYGISVGNNANPSGWTSDNSTSRYERIMTNIRMALQGDEREVRKTEADMADVNKQLAPFGFAVAKIYKDQYTKQIIFKKV